MSSIKTCSGILTPTLLNQLKFLLKDLNYKVAQDIGLQPLGKDTKLQGLSRITTDAPIDHLGEMLNLFGLFITEKVCEKSKINYVKIKRFMWNMYRNGEEGIFHNDGTNKNYLTILYSLNTSDGYLQINDAKFYDNEDEAKIFPSYLQHKGVGPAKDLLRLNLNIILEI